MSSILCMGYGGLLLLQGRYLCYPVFNDDYVIIIVTFINVFAIVLVLQLFGIVMIIVGIVIIVFNALTTNITIACNLL